MEDMDPHIEITIPTDRKSHLIKESELFTKYAGFSQDESFIAILDSVDQQFRLVAISCVSIDDMIHLPYEDIESKCGFTKIWKVDNNFNVEKCEIEIEHGGVIQFLPKAYDKAGDEANDVKANDKANEFTLILVKGLGIYKHTFSYSSESKQFQNNTLMLDYPERMIDALRYNYSKSISKYLTVPRDTTSGLVKPMTKIVIDPISENKPFKILSIRPFFGEDQIVWDKFDLKEHLKRSGLDQNWIKLVPSEHIITDSAPNAYGIGENNEFVEVSLTNLVEANPKYYLGIEPWTVHPAESIVDIYIKQRLQFPRYAIYLDTKQKTRLLIGYNTIQVWYEKRLEFIHVVNDDPDAPGLPYEKFKVVEIRYSKNKFDLLIEFEEGKYMKEKKVIRIKIEHEDDVIQMVMSAIKTLVYLDSQSKSVILAVGDKIPLKDIEWMLPDEEDEDNIEEAEFIWTRKRHMG
ncbi:15332_t:CDS:2 [Gigaspora rosea]|nr:15332_t:CDS:2 [Gigaspora rosea]